MSSEDITISQKNLFFYILFLCDSSLVFVRKNKDNSNNKNHHYFFMLFQLIMKVILYSNIMPSFFI